MIVARPNKPSEPDLLLGHESKPLLIHDLDGNELLSVPPPATGWTHALLEQFDFYKHARSGWEAYLGTTDNWIGCSEV